MNITSRRTFIKTAGATVVAAPIAEIASAAPTLAKQVQSHIDEIIRLMIESAPEGYEFGDMMYIVDGELGTSAFPPNYENGQTVAKYSTKRGEWFLST
jgi:hypothetical protein